ncbi:MAG TPA: nicotinate-nucleotide adenylyltransferase, partial [Pyrinomonadaceae bacterium]|nr:nicotinate-nucleotide adenylyltransferase [Pyrinomonadaceae bacterium]
AKKRIALYGGTFDPVHVGHLEVARRVSQLFEIEKLIFVPAQIAPHKIGRPVTEPLHRYAMLALATQEDSRLVISTFELDAPDRRYTFETIEHFQRELNDSTELFFIMGADSWSEITTWREWERLLTMTNHIVVTRPGYELATAHVGPLSERIVHVRTSVECGGLPLSQRAERATLPKAASSPRTPKIFLTDIVMNDASATNIRRLASEGRTEELVGLVPGPVLDYIKKYQIYREVNETELNS